MKKLIILSCLAILGFSSCKEDFQVAAPYKNITMVAAMLNMMDTAHYIRIQKAFMDENKGVIEMSQIADSSFYKNLTVTMKEYTNDVLTKSWDLTKVNMEYEGYPKEAPKGIGFFTMPSYAYKLKLPAGDSLSSYKKYKVFIRNNETGDMDSSDFVNVVNGNKSPTNPSDFQINDFENGSYQINFAKTEFKAAYTLFVRAPRNAKLIEGIMRFHFVEKNIITGEKKRLDADFYYDQQTRVNPEIFNLTTLNSSIYSFLYSSFGPAPANTQRYVDSCDLIVYAGNYELYNYMQISAVQNSSLLGDQVKPFYTNIRGNDAYGLICSRAVRIYKNVGINTVTIDSMKKNSITIPLNIQGRSDD